MGQVIYKERWMRDYRNMGPHTLRPSLATSPKSLESRRPKTKEAPAGSPTLGFTHSALAITLSTYLLGRSCLTKVSPIHSTQSSPHPQFPTPCL